MTIFLISKEDIPSEVNTSLVYAMFAQDIHEIVK